MKLLPADFSKAVIDLQVLVLQPSTNRLETPCITLAPATGAPNNLALNTAVLTRIESYGQYARAARALCQNYYTVHSSSTHK